jgi:hypothetical protein
MPVLLYLVNKNQTITTMVNWFILFTGKHLAKSGGFGPIKVAEPQPFVPVLSQASKRSCISVLAAVMYISVLAASILCLFLPFLLDFVSVPTVSYFCFSFYHSTK